MPIQGSNFVTISCIVCKRVDVVNISNKYVSLDCKQPINHQIQTVEKVNI